MSNSVSPPAYPGVYPGLIRGEVIAGFVDDNLFSCLECKNPFTDEPITEQDFLPGEKVICHRCGKIIRE